MKYERRDIEGYEGKYQIDTAGNVWSLHFGKEKKMRAWKHKSGYIHIELCKNGVQKSYKLHRLIAETFIPNPTNKPQVNHINGIKSDNSINNLEWVTSSENVKHSYNLGLQKVKKGEDNPNCKIANFKLPLIFELRREGFTHKKIAEIIGCSEASIQAILKGRYRK